MQYNNNSNRWFCPWISAGWGFSLLLSVVSKVEQNPEPGRAAEGATPFPCPYFVESTELKVFSCSMLALPVFQGRVTATGRVQLAVECLSPCVVGFGWGFLLVGFFSASPWTPHRPWETWVKALELCGVGFLGQNNPFPEKDLAFQQLGFVLIKLICAFCLPLLLCVSLYIL